MCYCFEPKKLHWVAPTCSSDLFLIFDVKTSRFETNENKFNESVQLASESIENHLFTQHFHRGDWINARKLTYAIIKTNFIEWWSFFRTVQCPFPLMPSKFTPVALDILTLMKMLSNLWNTWWFWRAFSAYSFRILPVFTFIILNIFIICMKVLDKHKFSFSVTYGDVYLERRWIPVVNFALNFNYF